MEQPGPSEPAAGQAEMEAGGKNILIDKFWKIKIHCPQENGSSSVFDFWCLILVRKTID